MTTRRQWGKFYGIFGGPSRSILECLISTSVGYHGIWRLDPNTELPRPDMALILSRWKSFASKSSGILPFDVVQVQVVSFRCAAFSFISMSANLARNLILIC